MLKLWGLSRDHPLNADSINTISPMNLVMQAKKLKYFVKTFSTTYAAVKIYSSEHSVNLMLYLAIYQMTYKLNLKVRMLTYKYINTP